MSSKSARKKSCRRRGSWKSGKQSDILALSLSWWGCLYPGFWMFLCKCFPDIFCLISILGIAGIGMILWFTYDISCFDICHQPFGFGSPMWALLIGVETSSTKLCGAKSSWSNAPGDVEVLPLVKGAFPPATNSPLATHLESCKFKVRKTVCVHIYILI